jgi:hypothetical protein
MNRGFLSLLCSGFLLFFGTELRGQISPCPDNPPGPVIDESDFDLATPNPKKKLRRDTCAIAASSASYYDRSRADWMDFWMFDDGTFFHYDHEVNRPLPGGPIAVSAGRVKVARRGRYHGDQEPPPAKRVVNTGANVPTSPVLLPTESARITPQWRAARIGDTVYMAITLKNTSNSPQNGYLRMRFPTSYLEFHGTEFTPAFLTPQTTLTSGANTILNWDIAGFPAGTSSFGNVSGIVPREYSVFVKFSVKPVLGVVPTDTSSRFSHTIEVDFGLNYTSSGTAPNGGGADAEKISLSEGKGLKRGSDSDAEAATPVLFTTTTSTTLAVNAARDPNSLEVDIREIEPTNSSDDILFTYTMNVENLGNVPATHLQVKTTFDKLLDGATFGYDALNDNYFPATSASMTTDTCLFFNRNPPVVYWAFVRALLEGVLPKSSKTNPDLNKAKYDFRIRLRPGQKLVEGDSIVCFAKVKMMGRAPSGERESEAGACGINFVLEDSVTTAPCIIRVVSSPKVQFGTVFGVKIHHFHNLFANDDSIGSSGIGLTARVPIFRPRFDNSRYQYMKRLPHWFWQFELGYVRNNILGPNNGRFLAEGIQLTPIQLRGIQPLRLLNRSFCIGASAGYNIAYMYKLNAGGREIDLPSTTDRFEHEVFGSIDIQNKIDVPNFTAGLGFKWRHSHMVANVDPAIYPFAYLQVDVLRIRRGFAKFWTKVYRW